MKGIAHTLLHTRRTSLSKLQYPLNEWESSYYRIGQHHVSWILEFPSLHRSACSVNIPSRQVVHIHTRSPSITLAHMCTLLINYAYFCTAVASYPGCSFKKKSFFHEQPGQYHSSVDCLQTLCLNGRGCYGVSILMTQCRAKNGSVNSKFTVLNKVVSWLLNVTMSHI